MPPFADCGEVSGEFSNVPRSCVRADRRRQAVGGGRGGEEEKEEEEENAEMVKTRYSNDVPMMLP